MQGKIQRSSVKVFILIIILAPLLCCFSYCSSIHKKMGFNKSSFVIVEEEDTHGGFLGDGTYYLILDCSQNADKARKKVKNWTPLPLSDNLQIAMYGGEIDGIHYSLCFAEEAHIPVIKNGVYKYYDENAHFWNHSDDTDLLERSSFNFEIAVYDFDKDFFYYFEIDT